MSNNRMIIKLEGARLIFKNFTGRAGKFNAEGMRSFAVILPEDSVSKIAKDGWNVKLSKPSDDEEERTPEHYLSVKVNFNNHPPRIFILTESNPNPTPVTEDMVETLDYANMANVDLIIQSYNYDNNGSTGISAYLKTMYITLDEDDLDRKYAVRGD